MWLPKANVAPTVSIHGPAANASSLRVTTSTSLQTQADYRRKQLPKWSSSTETPCWEQTLQSLQPGPGQMLRLGSSSLTAKATG